MSSVSGKVTIPAVIRHHAAEDTGSEFLRLLVPGQADQVLSYADLVDEASRWSAYYRTLGAVRGDRVVVVLPHSVALYAAYIGALLGGQIPAMFSFPSPKFSEELYFRTIGELIRGSQATLLVTYPELADKLRQRAGDVISAITMVTPNDLPQERWLPDADEAQPDDAAFLQYSSGTTGLKKGVAISHRALLWQIGAYGDAIKAGVGDRIVTWLPLYHDMGLIAAFFLPLIRKVPLVAMSPFDWVKRPAMWLQAVATHQGTLSWMPNFAYNFMARSVSQGELRGVDLSTMRGLVNCSEPVMAASHEAFLERFESLGFRPDALACSYAMAENTFAITSAGFGHPPLVDHVDAVEFAATGHARPVTTCSSGVRAIVSSGRALSDTRVIIAGADGSPLPDRQVGEIIVASPCLMSGYDNNAEATAAAMRNGLFHTGDLGYRVDGHVFVTGRKKDLIIIGGRNIYPQDIESAVSQVDGIAAGRAVAFGVADDAAGTERLVVLAETPEDDEGKLAALQTAVFAAVSERTEVVPSDIRLLPPRWLVKSSSGKIARAANRDRYLAEFCAATAIEAPVTVTGEERLIERVRAIVTGRLRQARRMAAVGDETPLVTSGLLDSFALADLVLALETGTGLSLPSERLQKIENIDTIAAIARTLEGGGHVDSESGEWWTEVPMSYGMPCTPRRVGGFWTHYYRLLFRLKGIVCGPGLQVLGPLLLQIDGKPGNIRFGTNVTLMPGVHLKNRENGKIILHDNAKLDTMVRLVSANHAVLELGENVSLGMATVINAGIDVRIGRGSLSSAHCMLNASDHGLQVGQPIRQQPYEHAPIILCEDVFLGAHSFVGKGSRIGSGAVVSAGALVSGDIPPAAIVQGRPARVIKFRA